MPARLPYVNPLQGTDSHVGFSTGNTQPLVARPFGTAHWTLQTGDGWGWQFEPRLKKLQGVRLTHQPGPWMGDYGAVTFLPQSGPRYTSAGRRATAYWLDRSTVKPHYLRTEIASSGVEIEMAPAVRGAVFRFRYPEGHPARIVVEAASGETYFEVREDRRTLVGYTRGNSGGVTESFAQHIVVVLDTDIESWATFYGDDVNREGEAQTGERLGVVLELGSVTEVTLKVGVSFIGPEQAELNLEREIGDRSLEDVKAEAERAWEEVLGGIEVETDDETELRTFTSCLYRTALFPRIWHEEDAEGKVVHHSPYDGQVHEGVLYADTGFWDTYRTLFPLWTLNNPGLVADILRGFVSAYKESGWFPQWPSPGHRSCMPGTHMDATIADAVVKGITDFDVETALEGMLRHADHDADVPGAGRPGIEDYLEHGYCLPVGRAVAHTLDYAYDDWCIAQVARHLGRTEDEKRLLERSQNYRKVYDPAVGFMRAKNADGSWWGEWDEFYWGGPYCEGGPWQNSWAVQHDPAGLMALMGGEEAFAAKLDTMMVTPPLFRSGGYGGEIHEMTEMAMADFGQYAQSNQPVHHVLFMYLAAGRPAGMQRMVRRTMAELYTPDVLPGDEDNGEMAAWYVLNAPGLYPHCPGRPEWALGSPLFKRAVMKLPNGRELIIESPANSPENVYVASVSWNGEKIAGTVVPHAWLAEGGTLQFEMTDQPNEAVVPVKGRPGSQTPYPL